MNALFIDTPSASSLVGLLDRGVTIFRHSVICRPGLWCAVLSTDDEIRKFFGLAAMPFSHATVDDFGNLVAVA